VRSRFAAGEIPASTVRQWAAFELFSGRAGRTYWAAAGRRQLANSKGRYNSFFCLLDDEYKKAISSGFPVAKSTRTGTAHASPKITPEVRDNSPERAYIAVIAAIAGIAIGWLWRRKNIVIPDKI
jgi:hypothetical protein